jgi:spoIIIJ-associated protein
VVSQAENAGTVASGDTAGQALAGGGGEPVGTGVGSPEDVAPDDLDVALDDVAADEADDAAADEDDEADEEDSAPADADEAQPEVDLADLEQESEIAADYVEGLLDVADLDGDIDMDVEGDRALVSVVGATLQELIGPHGEVLEALQELTRLAVHRQTGARTRIMLDVGGYRARRRVELTELGQDAAEDVKSSGVPRRLDAMTPFERKVVHDAIAAAGLRSESEGEEPNRRVVVFPVG